MKFHFTDTTEKAFWATLAMSFLTATALCTVFHEPLAPSYYEATIDFVIASLYELLGSYDVKLIFLWIFSFYFYSCARVGGWTLALGKDSSWGLACFFAACLLLGQSYYETTSSAYCFGSAVNFVKFLISMAGYALLFHALIDMMHRFLRSHAFFSVQEHFFTRRPFVKAFLIILGSYLPFLLLSFPGQLCWDSIGEIEQVLGEAPYSLHHPLFHTLFMGGLVRMGWDVFQSPEIGLFAYMLLQDIMLAAALAATIAVLARRRAKLSLLLCLLVLYCVTPAYSNMASTVVKDVPYCAAMIGYVICLGLLLEKPKRLKYKKYIAVFLLLQVGVILFRNNGLYVILLSGIACFVFLIRKTSKKQRFLLLFVTFAGGILIAKLLLFVLVRICDAQPGSMGEMLSVPFQQTARYLQLYGDEIDEEEREGIEGVLGDVDKVIANYDPAIADPVKSLYYKNATATDLVGYLKAWLKSFLKHPASYVEAFLLHVYGWFSPFVSNSIRYEVAGYEAIRQTGLFPDANKILIFYYRFAAHFMPLAILENIGCATWGLFFLAFYQKRRCLWADAFAALPLWVSLLVCMASPCFFKHPRYAFPILFTLPFLYGFTLTSGGDTESDRLS